MVLRVSRSALKNRADQLEQKTETRNITTSLLIEVKLLTQLLGILRFIGRDIRRNRL